MLHPDGAQRSRQRIATRGDRKAVARTRLGRKLDLELGRLGDLVAACVVAVQSPMFHHGQSRIDARLRDWFLLGEAAVKNFAHDRNLVHQSGQRQSQVVATSQSSGGLRAKAR